VHVRVGAGQLGKASLQSIACVPTAVRSVHNQQQNHRGWQWPAGQTQPAC
jgi:hypothetical protein